MRKCHLNSEFALGTCLWRDGVDIEPGVEDVLDEGANLVDVEGALQVSVELVEERLEGGGGSDGDT